MNVRFTTQLWAFPAVSVFFITAGLVLVMISDRDILSADAPKRTTPVAFGEVADIVHKRCTRCHSERPTDTVYHSAPNGVMFDNPDEIIRKASDIKQRAVTLKNMPLANVTGITDEERATIGAWIDQGAKGPEAP